MFINEFAFLKHPFWDSLFCLITDEFKEFSTVTFSHSTVTFLHFLEKLTNSSVASFHETTMLNDSCIGKLKS